MTALARLQVLRGKIGQIDEVVAQAGPAVPEKISDSEMLLKSMMNR